MRNQSWALDSATIWRSSLMWIAGQQFFYAHVLVTNFHTFIVYLILKYIVEANKSIIIRKKYIIRRLFYLCF